MVYGLKIFRPTAVLLLGGLFVVGLVGSGAAWGAEAPGLTRTHSGGGVTVAVTYLNPQSAEGARFQVVLDTHSVNLDGYDLTQLSSLRDDAGRTYEASGVENTGSGHHRTITLLFPKPAPAATALELTLRDVAGIPERLFQWQIQ